MPSLKALCLVLLVLCFAAPVSAQTVFETKITIDYSNGEKVAREHLSIDQATDAFLEFLKSDRDGRFQVIEKNQIQMDMLKTGEQLELTQGGRTQTGTVSKAIANFERARAAGYLGSCRANLKNIATALEMWATDHGGRYPDGLARLVPDYLTHSLTCPASEGQDSYASGYTLKSARSGFTVRCNGDHSRAAVPPGFPTYDHEQGLSDR